MSIPSVSIFSGMSPGVLALMQFIRPIRPTLIGTTASPSYPYQRKSKYFMAPDDVAESISISRSHGQRRRRAKHSALAAPCIGVSA